MVISFSVPKARKRLMKKGVVVTFRSKRRKQLGQTWCNLKRGGKKIADVYIIEIGHITSSHDLMRHVPRSGFDSLNEWVYEINKMMKPSQPWEGWLYAVCTLSLPSIDAT